MNHAELMRRLVTLLPHLLMTGVLTFALTATYLGDATLPWHWMVMIRAEIKGACEHPDVQWMTVVLVALYFIGFAALHWLQVRIHPYKFRLRTRLVLIVALVGWGIASYALDYRTAAGSDDALVLLTMLAVGQSVAFWLGWEDSARFSMDGLRLSLLRLLAVLLAFASLVHPTAIGEFQYRGEARWVGLWQNPNSFGVLMAVGFVLNLGLLIEAWRGFWAAKQAGGSDFHSSDICASAVWLLGSVASGTGLLFSYSRGGWVGAVVGIGWLGWRTLCGTTKEPFALRLLLLRRCAPALALIALSLGLIAFWSQRHTEIPLLRRILTVGNPNDFSWRNRVDTWPGALELLARRPLTGWGWNCPLIAYDHGHKPVWLSEAGAIALNEYLMLGMTLGVPVIWAFLIWIRLAWRLNVLLPNSPPNTTPSSLLGFQPLLTALPRAALLPMLIGFIFDGGLSKLAIAVPFCVLLELSVESDRDPRINTSEVRACK